MVITKTYKRYYKVKKFLPIFCKLYPNKPIALLKQELKELVKNKSYKLLVVFDGVDPIAIASLNEGFLLYCGKYLQISNLYVESKHRNIGIAKMLIGKAEEYAKKSHCKYVVLDSYVTNKASHKTYVREGFEPKANHFMKSIN